MAWFDTSIFTMLGSYSFLQRSLISDIKFSTFESKISSFTFGLKTLSFRFLSVIVVAVDLEIFFVFNETFAFEGRTGDLSFYFSKTERRFLVSLDCLDCCDWLSTAPTTETPTFGFPPVPGASRQFCSLNLGRLSYPNAS